jgi:hypothetical protein
MKLYVRLYLTEIFFDWEMFQTNTVPNIKTHILF